MTAEEALRIRRAVELETLAEILEEVDYYALLQVPRDASADVVEAAFRTQTRELHPDKYFALGAPELRAQAQDVFRTINEAWRVLRDPATRQAYDARLESGGTRLSSMEIRDARESYKKREDLLEATKHPQARKHWDLALQAQKKKDLKGALMNVQFALTFEPENQILWEFMQKVQAKLG